MFRNDRHSTLETRPFGKRRLVSVLMATLLALLSVLPTGSAFAARDGRVSILRDDEIEALLREFSDPIFKVAGLKPEDVQIILIDDPSLNAFVANGQRVHLHTGLILAVDTPNQLKAVIAHETGHISAGHLVRSREAIAVAQRPALVSIGLGVLAIALGAGDLGSALIVGSSTFAYANFFSYTRGQEAGADQAAAGYLEATNQPVTGLMEFLDKIRDEESYVDPARRSPYMRTHPFASDRVAALRARAAAGPHTPDSAVDVARLRMIQAKLWGFLYPNRVLNHYPMTDTSEPARYARAIAAFRAKPADIPTALKEMRTLVKQQPDNPYFQELLGQVLFESEGNIDSIQYHRRALELRPNSPLFMVNLARSLTITKDADQAAEAAKLLQRALALEPNNAFAWYTLADAWEKMGERAKAEYASSEYYFALGDYRLALDLAKRAMESGLDKSSPEWNGAADVMTVAGDAMNRQRKER